MTNEEFAEWFKKKTKLFAIEVTKFMEKIPNSPSINVIRFQLIKSVTSTAANYRAVCRARSDKEFYAKLCIVVEEADETQFWLEVIEGLEKDNQNKIKILLKEASEIVAITTKARQSAEKKLEK
jgi:four helix bundle protein